MKSSGRTGGCKQPMQGTQKMSARRPCRRRPATLHRCHGSVCSFRCCRRRRRHRACACHRPGLPRPGPKHGLRYRRERHPGAGAGATPRVCRRGRSDGSVGHGAVHAATLWTHHPFPSGRRRRRWHGGPSARRRRPGIRRGAPAPVAARGSLAAVRGGRASGATAACVDHRASMWRRRAAAGRRAAKAGADRRSRVR